MKLTHLPDQGYMADGHGLNPVDAIAEALIEHARLGGEAPARPLGPSAVVEAWWGGDEIGFCQEHHDGAQPVTVIHLPGA